MVNLVELAEMMKVTTLIKEKIMSSFGSTWKPLLNLKLKEIIH